MIFFSNLKFIAPTDISDYQGVKFDPQTGSTLHIELARSNSRRKPKPGILLVYKKYKSEFFYFLLQWLKFINDWYPCPEAYVVIDKRSIATKDDQDSSDDGNDPSDTL